MLRDVFSYLFLVAHMLVFKPLEYSVTEDIFLISSFFFISENIHKRKKSVKKKSNQGASLGVLRFNHHKI